MLSLIGVLIVIVGFALKLDAILIIVIAAIVTALCGGLSAPDFLETLGTSFVANRSMNTFIITMLLVGTLERNGLKSAAADLIRKLKGVSAGVIIAVYSVVRYVTAAFNISFGGVAGFIRPVLMPMAIGAVTNTGVEITPEYEEFLKCTCGACENMAWFFAQLLFMASGGTLLIQSTLETAGFTASLVDIAKVQVPVAIFAAVLTVGYAIVTDRMMYQKTYGKTAAKVG